MRLSSIILAASALLGAAVSAAPSMTTSGVIIMVPVTGEVRHVNEEVNATFQAGSTKKDKAEATSEVSRKMKEGVAILRARNPAAVLQTAAFRFYPLHKKTKLGSFEEPDRVPEVIGWEVTQRVTLVTQDMAGLPKTSAALQGTLDLVTLNFHLTSETTRKLDDLRTMTAYQRLNERIESFAKAMGKSMGDATLESVSIDGAGETNHFDRVEVTGSKIRRDEMAEPVFEAGETTLSMRLIGKVRFK